MLEAIVLAGGFGTRLKETVPDLPKPMAPVNGKPFLAYLLDNLSKKGFGRVILSVGYMSEKIIDYFGPQYAGLEIFYSKEETPLGTGGATRLAFEYSREDHVYVINGDTYLDFNEREVEILWRLNSCPIIIASNVNNAQRFGLIEYKDGLVTRFLEKGIKGPGAINTGYYVFKKSQLKDFIKFKYFSLELDYLNLAVNQQPFQFLLQKGLFIDIGIPEDYFKAQNILC